MALHTALAQLGVTFVDTIYVVKNNEW